jgi:osmotically inducible protein OsmC
MPIQLTKVSYTTSASARGGRAGHVRSADGLVDFDLAQPGTTPEPAVNPETLFAAGYAACFQGALANRAKTKGIDTSDSTVTAHVSFGSSEDGGFGLAVDLEVDHSGRRGTAGLRTGRAGAPVLPLLEGHPRQHRRDADRRLTV